MEGQLQRCRDSVNRM